MDSKTETIQEFKKNDLIFEEGDEGNLMYVVKKGVVKIFRERRGQTTIMARLNEGDFFGEMSVFTGLERSASAQADTDCQLAVIDKQTLLNLVEEPVVWRILQKLSDRIMEFDNRVVDLLVEDELAKVMQLFRRYVAPKVVDKILHNAGQKDMDLSGELREVTVLFADIRNFTTIAEKLPPHKVVELLNTYLGQMTQVIFRYDGTVDKYIGDCIMAIFNAPVKQEKHAEKAVEAGLKILEKISELQKNGENISVGIGINTGRAVIGNIGTDLHLDYTVIGDAVNIASRLCRIAPPGELLISDQTYSLVEKDFEVEERSEHQFKGKARAVKVYNVLATVKKANC